jgi:hypothetical protein
VSARKFMLILAAFGLILASFFGYKSWLDREFLIAKWNKSLRMPIAKIDTRVFYESDLYDASDTARQFGVKPEVLLDQFLKAQKTIIAGEKLHLFPNQNLLKEAEAEVFPPKLPGGLDVPEGVQPPLIYKKPSNWKSLQTKAEAVRNLAEAKGLQERLAETEAKLFVRVWMRPLQEYPEGR